MYRTVYEVKFDGAYPITLEYNDKARLPFRVVYGMQQRTNLSYERAARELGYCIMHALACDDRIAAG